jgi:carbon monoxide dehydrogenase subunit G
MKIEGSHEIPAPQDQVWSALLDPDKLALAIPGAEKLEEIGPNEYKATMKVGVGPVKGTFEGKVRLSDLEPPNRYKMAMEGTGGPGFVRGQAVMELGPGENNATLVKYNADVQIGGLIASVGQRMLGGVSRMMLDQFFGRMSEILAEKK